MNPDALEQALAAERLPVDVVDVDPAVLRVLDIETAGAIKAGPVFDLSDGIADDLARISDTIAADGLRSLGGGRLPWNYVITTLGAAVAAAYGLGLALRAAGLKGPIPMAAAGVAAPLVIEVIQKRRRSE
jgi:hypothetical protein